MTDLAFPKPSRLDRKNRKRLERETRMAKVSRLRDEALARSLHKCEAPDCRAGGRALHLDHWLGGIGRRRLAESIQTVWMLCVPCHEQRTRNVPSVEWWNDAFAKHCAFHGYPTPRRHLAR
jgi:hypothetical protein